MISHLLRTAIPNCTIVHPAGDRPLNVEQSWTDNGEGVGGYRRQGILYTTICTWTAVKKPGIICLSYTTAIIHIHIYTWKSTCTHGFNMTVRRGQSYVRNCSSKTFKNIQIISLILWENKYSYLKKNNKSRVLLTIPLFLNVSNFTKFSPSFQDSAQL
jgi:hypothetical protein